MLLPIIRFRVEETENTEAQITHSRGDNPDKSVVNYVTNYDETKEWEIDASHELFHDTFSHIRVTLRFASAAVRRTYESKWSERTLGQNRLFNSQ